MENQITNNAQFKGMMTHCDLTFETSVAAQTSKSPPNIQFARSIVIPISK